MAFPWIFLALIPVFGCAQHEIELHPEAFNRAIGSLDTRLLLLNAVRASKNYPIEFTSVSTVLGGAKVNSELDPSLPFPFNPSRSYDPGIKIAHERGFSQLNIANLNTKEAKEGLKRPLSLLDVRSYVLSGWPSELLETITWEEIKVHPAVQQEIDRLTAKKCGATRDIPVGHDYSLCATLTYWRQACDGQSRGTPGTIAGVPMFRYFNWPTSKCQYAKFQYILAQLSILRVTLLPLTKIVKEKVIDTGKVLEKETKHTVMRFAFEDPELNDLMVHYNKSLEPIDLGGLQITLRSVERMVRYLGELIALQNYSHERFTPKVVIDGKLVDLFVVTQEGAESVNAAISVQDNEGEWFFVPTPLYGAAERHRSLQVMALIIDILNASVSRAAIPQVQTVTLSTP